jgi:alkanesulfonate monooxygenase SsuD/methylene tetrahydromethanopterin reductase-like flavin-dependent oxidoreductase (luciferase family)
MASKTKFGITFIPPFPPEKLVEYGHMAEAAGFDSLWIYEDCFYAGGFASAATLLAATQHIQVGIGLLPIPVRNPLFMAMEIATLARLYPGRFLPGLGHGVDIWMKQIGVYPKSPLKALEETVTAVRGLLAGEEVTRQGTHVHLDRVKLQVVPGQVPPLYVGGVREKTLRLSGRVGDGSLLTCVSSPAYVRWAIEQINAGLAEAGKHQHRMGVWAACKVGSNGQAARAPVRRWLAEAIQYGDAHLFPLGIQEEVPRLFQKYGLEQGIQQMPEAWLDELTASGTPDQAAAAIQRLIEAGANEVMLAPVENDPHSFTDTVRYLRPFLKG